MARDKRLAPNVDNSNPSLYPNGKIQDNTGSGNGTPVNNYVYSDLHEMKDKLFRLYGIEFNGLPDNETNGFQTIDALRGLASKNDFILDLVDNSGVLNVPIKLGFMLQNESVICLASFDLGAQTQIKGSDNVTYSATFVGSFKSGEYVRLIKTSSGITLIREVDAVNLNLAVSELSYLKKATQTQENAGAIDTVATTPLTNKTVFERRVNGVDSGDYLATPLQNGLLSKEDKLKLDTETLIVVTSGNSVEVESSSGGNLQNNFNFNYVDIFPPPGKTMANLKGFMVSMAESWVFGDANDDSWCKYQIQESKIRAICGCQAPQQPFKINWLAIWI